MHVSALKDSIGDLHDLHLLHVLLGIRVEEVLVLIALHLGHGGIHSVLVQVEEVHVFAYLATNVGLLSAA